MKQAIIGAKSLVGQELIGLLAKRNETPLLFGSKQLPNHAQLEQIDTIYFCTSASISKQSIPALLCLKKELLCIDASSAFRLCPNTPLIIPEINPKEARSKGCVSSPNCTTTLMLLPLFPLHKAFGINRIVATTFQAISGAGRKALEELKAQSQSTLKGQEPEKGVFPSPCAFNFFPHESPMEKDGYVAEEEKMAFETKKILDDQSIQVSARCIRTPTFRSHGISLNVQFHSPLLPKKVVSLIQDAPGVTYMDNASALDAQNKHSVFCGNVRLDKTQDNTLEMWIVGDQLLKGAALNMLQIKHIICNNKQYA